MIWRIRFGDGTWSWTTPELSNGWKACVTDRSQFDGMPTTYTAWAIHPAHVPQMVPRIASFSVAKMLAFNLALSQAIKECPTK